MPGEGAMSHMRITMKNNNALLRKRGYFKLKKEFLEGARSLSIDLKKATPEQLRQIRERLIQRNRRMFRRKIYALLIAIVFCVLLFWGMQYGILMLFGY